MRLVIVFSVWWSVMHASDGRARAILPGHEGPPDLVVEVSAIEAAPPELDVPGNERAGPLGYVMRR